MRPFSIFPSKGYRNSQFQIISTLDKLIVSIENEGTNHLNINVSSSSPTILTKLDKPGKYVASCVFNGNRFEQIIEVKNAYRLGESVFKRAFIFDDIKYVFLLMKDRMLIYDEKRDLFLTENGYSPTLIKKIDNNHLLFITKISSEQEYIMNFGVYSLATFDMIGELLNNYVEISILPSNNKLWISDFKSKRIYCYEFINNDGSALTELRKYEIVIKYVLLKEYLFIELDTHIIIINIFTLEEINVEKKSNVAISKNSSVFTIKGEIIVCSNFFNNYEYTIQLPPQINFDQNDFIFVGEAFMNKTDSVDYSDLLNSILAQQIPKMKEDDKYLYIPISDKALKQWVKTSHLCLPSAEGVYWLKRKTIYKIRGATLKKDKSGHWGATLEYQTSDVDKLTLETTNESIELIQPIRCYDTSEYFDTAKILHYLSSKRDVNGEKMSFGNKVRFEILKNGNRNYFIAYIDGGTDSVYEMANLERPLLQDIVILNLKYIMDHNAIWYHSKEGEKDLNCFFLKDGTSVKINDRKIKNDIYSKVNYTFKSDYILANGILINPKDATIKDSQIGELICYSESLNKVLTKRMFKLHFLKFNLDSTLYFEKEIKIGESKYNESYLSPDGGFLMLSNEANTYLLYDIVKNETIKYFSGTFVTFSKEGNLIFEEKNTRVAKILDPLTFADITPPNYRHYRFISPDGKLYAQVASKTRYYDRLTQIEISYDEVKEISERFDFGDRQSQSMRFEERQKLKVKQNIIKENRQEFLVNNLEKLKELNIEDCDKVESKNLVKREKYTEIGVVGTNNILEIIFPEDISFYNYSAFSNDNRFFGYVGKPSSKGLICLLEISYNEQTQNLTLVNSYESRYPRFASWVCGFSKTGYFATYDSEPDTYLIKCDDNFFRDKVTDEDLCFNIPSRKSNIYQSYKNWIEIKKKNFLCFSPSGKYLALSEQGYEPLTLGGYGHQESNAVHIAQTETGEIIESFLDHGDKIQENKWDKLVFVAFSEDEKNLMTLSSDGVVIIREINLIN